MVNRCIVYECGNEPKPDVALYGFHRQRLSANDGVALFVEQGVIEMGLKNSVICSKYFLGSKFDKSGPV